MAVPKRKTSPSKRNMRRSHDSLVGINTMECSNCGERKLSHRVCGVCGYYNKREIIKKIDLNSEKDLDSED